MSRKDELERDAEYHRRKVMSQDERNLDSRNRLADRIYKQAEVENRRMTYEDATRKAAEIAHKVQRGKR